MPLEAAAHPQSDLYGITVDSNELLSLGHLAKDLHLENRVKSRSLFDGSSRSSRRGRGMEFAEVRHYQAGDDIRNIDWRVTARTQETYTKLFQEEKERPVYILVDQRNTMFFGSRLQFKSVLAARLASVIAWSAFHNKDKLGALIFGNQSQSDLRPKQGRYRLFQFVQELSTFNQSLLENNAQTEDSKAKSAAGEKQSITSMVQELQRVAKPGSLVFLISDFHDFDKASFKALTLLSRHNELELIQISDPFESSLPKSGRLPLWSRQKRVVVNSASKTFQEKYQSDWLQQKQFVEDCALGLNANFRLLSTSRELDEQLAFLRKSKSMRRR